MIFLNVTDVLGPVDIKSLKPAFHFTLPLTENPVEFKLSAIIDYKIPRSTRNQNSIHNKGPISKNRQNEMLNTLGHYTAICRRSDNTWMEYDDLQDKEIKGKQTCTPEILMYIKK